MIEFAVGFGKGIAASASPGYVYNKYQQYKNRSLTDEIGNAAILVAYPLVSDKIIGRLYHTQIGLWGSVSKFFTASKVKCHFKYNATSHDLEQAVIDPAFSSIVVVGHGGRDFWVTEDKKEVGIEEMYRWSKNVPKKRGYFFQLTCGEDTQKEPLGFPIMMNPEHCRGYTGNVNTLKLLGAPGNTVPLYLK